MTIEVHRIYDGPAAPAGKRVLVDRLWPRGIRSDAGLIDEWIKEVAPSNELRQWYGHDPAKWEEFRHRYFTELEDQPEAVERLLAHARGGDLILLYSSKERALNNAVALREYLQARLG